MTKNKKYFPRFCGVDFKSPSPKGARSARVSKHRIRNPPPEHSEILHFTSYIARERKIGSPRFCFCFPGRASKEKADKTTVLSAVYRQMPSVRPSKRMRDREKTEMAKTPPEAATPTFL